MNTETGFALLLANVGIGLLILCCAGAYNVYVSNQVPVEGKLKIVASLDANATLEARKLLIGFKTAMKEDINVESYKSVNVSTETVYQFKNGEWVIVKGAQ